MSFFALYCVKLLPQQKQKKDDVVWGSTTLKLLWQELWNLFLMRKILRVPHIQSY